MTLGLSNLELRPPAEGRVCCNHPEVTAPQVCSSCKNPICKTCTFKFPGTVRRLCPACLTQGDSNPSSRRRNYAIGSLALTGFAMVLFVLLAFSAGDSPDDFETSAIGVVLLVSVLAGAALGMTTIEYNLKNTPLYWFAAIAGGVFLALFVLAASLGILMG